MPIIFSILNLDIDMFVNNSGHDVVVKPGRYKEGEGKNNIIVPDGATRFEDVESGLNKMTLKKFGLLSRICG